MNFQTISVNNGTLQLVLNVLENLHQLGGTADGELWLSGKCYSELERLPQDCDALRPGLQDALSCMQRLRGMRDVLNNLAESCDVTLNEMKTQLGPSFMHCGIQMLPNESLGRIFEHCVLADTDAWRVPEVKLSQVCSRFRSVALSTPALWSRLSSRMSKDWIEERLRRSKSHPLEMIIGGTRSLKRRDEFVNLVRSVSARWMSLRILSVDIASPYKNARFDLSELSLPNLRHFFVAAEDLCNAVEILDISQVYDVELRDCIPSPESSLSGSISIRCLSLKLHDDRCDTVDLIGFLQSLPNLDELHLKLNDRTCGYNRRENRNPTGGVLRNVRFLSLETGVPRIFSEIVGHLNMPVLEKLDLCVFDYLVDEEDEGYVTAGEWVCLIPLDRYESVKELKFIFWHGSREKFTVGSLLQSFPALQRLDLDITENRAEVDDSWDFDSFKAPPLRTFSIPHEVGADIDFLTDFVELMKRNGRWEDFESFYFTCGNMLSRTNVEKILTKDKLQWFD